jgi:lipoate-protein ligase A
MNMAVDEALFLAILSGSAPPTVRLYTWSRPSISIGFRQNLAEACDLEACRSLGVDMVRRISGGRAVLHHHELTYCVTASAEGDFRGLTVLEIYRWVTDALRATFVSMDVAVDPPADEKTPDPDRGDVTEKDVSLPCFAVPTGHEITSGGRKLVGSAQKWTRRGFLQHGSIILKLDQELWKKTTALDRSSDLGAIGLDELTKRPVERSELETSLQKSFEAQFCEPSSTHELSKKETDIARILAREKYSSDAWNLHRKAVFSHQSPLISGL